MESRRIVTRISIVLNVVFLLSYLGYEFGALSLIKSKVIGTETQASFTSHYYDRKSSFEILANDSAGSIIFLGDSITEGVEWSELFLNPNIKNRGIGTDTTEGVLNRIDNIVKLAPSKIFIMIGINDIGNGVETAEIVKNYKEILSYLKSNSPSTVIHVQSVLPCNSQIMDNNARNNKRNETNIKLLNAEIKRISSELGVEYIDLYSKFVNINGDLDKKITNDGIHLNGDGYLLWKDVINSYLKNS